MASYTENALLGHLTSQIGLLTHPHFTQMTHSLRLMKTKLYD